MKRKIQNICHLTSVHEYYDPRIFVKECAFLSKNGYEIHLVAPLAPEAIINGVILHSVPFENKNRLKRITKTVWCVYKKALNIDADLYHIHDPELLPIGLLLKLKKKIIIFDMHEDIPNQILDKSWIDKRFRKIISKTFSIFQSIVLNLFDGVVIAESSYIENIHTKTPITVVRNYPIISEFQSISINNQCEKSICYVGTIHESGIYEMISAAEVNNIKLLLVGEINENLLGKLKLLSGWNNVEWLGFQDRNGVIKALERSTIGMVILYPLKNYLRTEPTKMFEYMAAGKPFIASNFPDWEQIVLKYKCGICVDPLNVMEISATIRKMLDNPEKTLVLGLNGRKAVEDEFSWENEFIKLLRLYKSLGK